MSKRKKSSGEKYEIKLQDATSFLRKLFDVYHVEQEHMLDRLIDPRCLCKKCEKKRIEWCYGNQYRYRYAERQATRLARQEELRKVEEEKIDKSERTISAVRKIQFAFRHVIPLHRNFVLSRRCLRDWRAKRAIVILIDDYPLDTPEVPAIPSESLELCKLLGSRGFITECWHPRSTDLSKVPTKSNIMALIDESTYFWNCPTLVPPTEQESPPPKKLPTDTVKLQINQQKRIMQERQQSEFLFVYVACRGATGSLAGYVPTKKTLGNAYSNQTPRGRLRATLKKSMTVSSQQGTEGSVHRYLHPMRTLKAHHDSVVLLETLTQLIHLIPTVQVGYYDCPLVSRALFVEVSPKPGQDNGFSLISTTSSAEVVFDYSVSKYEQRPQGLMTLLLLQSLREQDTDSCQRQSIAEIQPPLVSNITITGVIKNIFTEMVQTYGIKSHATDQRFQVNEQPTVVDIKRAKHAIRQLDLTSQHEHMRLQKALQSEPWKFARSCIDIDYLVLVSPQNPSADTMSAATETTETLQQKSKGSIVSHQAGGFLPRKSVAANFHGSSARRTAVVKVLLPGGTATHEIPSVESVTEYLTLMSQCQGRITPCGVDATRVYKVTLVPPVGSGKGFFLKKPVEAFWKNHTNSDDSSRYRNPLTLGSISVTSVVVEIVRHRAVLYISVPNDICEKYSECSGPSDCHSNDLFLQSGSTPFTPTIEELVKDEMVFNISKIELIVGYHLSMSVTTYIQTTIVLRSGMGNSHEPDFMARLARVMNRRLHRQSRQGSNPNTPRETSVPGVLTISAIEPGLGNIYDVNPSHIKLHSLIIVVAISAINVEQRGKQLSMVLETAKLYRYRCAFYYFEPSAWEKEKHCGKKNTQWYNWMQLLVANTHVCASPVTSAVLPPQPFLCDVSRGRNYTLSADRARTSSTQTLPNFIDEYFKGSLSDLIPPVKGSKVSGWGSRSSKYVLLLPVEKEVRQTVLPPVADHR